MEKVAPAHKRLIGYETMTLEDIKALPNGLAVMDAWGVNTKGILFGKPCAKTAILMAEASVFTFGMSRNDSFSA